jgi:hypothetical protein
MCLPGTFQPEFAQYSSKKCLLAHIPAFSCAICTLQNVYTTTVAAREIQVHYGYKDAANVLLLSYVIICHIMVNGSR